MKKNTLKITLFILCVALTVFLLLPFLDNSKSNTASLNVKAEPQIFTSNPLTALMNRLASLFGRPDKEKPTTVLTAQQVDQMFGTQVPIARTAAATVPSVAQDTRQPSQEGTSWEQPTRVDMSDALVLNEEGNWVLARQVYPESSPQGMHEINIKDNPYDTYIRQQKAATYNPALGQPEIGVPPTQKESYWHKLVSPIKHFFGFDEAQAITPGQFQQMAGGSQETTAVLTQAVNKTNWNPTETTSSTAKATSPDFSFDIPEGISASAKRGQRTRDLYRMLHPESLLQHAVETLANSKFPEPLNEKQRVQKQQFSEETTHRLVEQLKEWQRARMERYFTNQSALENFRGACQNESLPVTSGCPAGEVIPGASEQAIRETQIQNQQIFSQITRIPLPNIPLTPVLGIANGPLNLKDEDNTFTAPPQNEQGLVVTNEIYEWQFKHHGCDKKENSCFYVANKIQKDPALGDSIRMTNGSFVGDPANIYPKDKAAFISYRDSKLPKNASEELRAKTAAKAAEDYEKFAPPHVIYTSDVGAEYQQKVARVMRNPNSDEEVPLLLMLNGSQARTLQEMTNSTAFLYDSQSAILEEDGVPAGKLSNSVVESSAVLIKETRDYVTQIAQELNQEAVKNNLGNTKEFFNRSVVESGGNALQAFEQAFSVPPPDKK